MIPVYQNIIDTCIVCGEVCAADALWYIETAAEATAHDGHVGDCICADCAGLPRPKQYRR